jgi:hypothetical protein
MSLLEILLACALLGSSGVATLGLARQAVMSVRQAHEHESEMLAASQFLDAVALWPRQGLDQRLGARRQGPWILHVERPVEALYRVTLLNAQSGKALLVTAVYRPQERSGL